MAKRYLFALQDQTGREITSAYVETDKVGDVTARLNEDRSLAFLEHKGEEINRGSVASSVEEVVLLRWPAEDKLSTPVRKTVD